MTSRASTRRPRRPRNYTLGVKEQIIFPRSTDTVEKVKGLNISITTTARKDEEGRALLQHPGCRSVPRTEWRDQRGTCPAFAKLQTAPKFAVRHRNRCKVCGRARGTTASSELCRVCLRVCSLRGEIPGVIKASW